MHDEAAAIKTHKILIAIEFIETAAELYRHRVNYFSAIHLAAAAEEITGKACRIINAPSYFDEIRAFVVRGLSSTNRTYSNKEINSVYYGIKTR